MRQDESMDRDAWAAEVAETVLDGAAKRHRDTLIAACDHDALLAAWVVVHIATGHVNGVAARDLALALETWRPGNEWSTITVETISEFRRYGLPPQVNEDLWAAWDSLLQLVVCARGFQAVQPDLLAFDDATIRIDRARDREPTPEPDATAILEMFPIDDLSPMKVWPFRVPASHLDAHIRAIRGLQRHLREDDANATAFAASYVRGLKGWLTTMEFVNLFEDSNGRLLLDEALDASKRLISLTHTMRGGWADVYPHSTSPWTPQWLRDQVVTGGARSQKYTTGSLHTWILVSEGPWDRARVERVLREVEKVGFVPLDGAFVVKVFLPEFAGDSDELQIDYQYHLDDPDQLRGALVMLATGALRFEVFALEGGSLTFLGARSLSIPADLIGAMSPLVRRALGPDPSDTLSQLGMMKIRLADEDTQAEARFVGSENARYEHLWNLSLLRPRVDLTPIACDDFEAARRGYLAAESRLARLLLGGQPVDEEAIVASSRRDFEMAVSARPQQWQGTESCLEVLGQHQAFLHVDYRDGMLDWTAAGVGTDDPWYLWTSSQVDQRVVDAINGFRRVRHGAAANQRSSWRERASIIDVLVSVLNESVAEMAERLAIHNVTSIVASPGADLDGMPIHLLDFGALAPSCISYAPSTSFLAAINADAREGEDVAVLTYAGLDDDIPNVRVEAAVVAGVRSGRARQVDDAKPDDLLVLDSRFIHVSCHGLASGRLGLRGLMLSPGDASGFVSAADILATDGFFETDVVFLSACSSSVADHTGTVVQSFGGVDFAFIGAGARSAVASQWDVSDVASVIYAAEFHAMLVEAGSTRGAYDAAQRALKSDLASLSDRAREELNRYWSGWHDSWMKVPSRTHAVHWGAFRLSGLV